jgi:hypothetical protein
MNQQRTPEPPIWPVPDKAPPRLFRLMVGIFLALGLSIAFWVILITIGYFLFKVP